MSIISRLKTYYYDFYNWRLLKSQKVNHGERLFIGGPIFLENRGGTITIGSDVHINSATIQDPIGGQNQTIIVCDPTGEILIGNNVGISNAAFFSQRKIVIEDNVMIGGGVKIYDTDFHSVEYTHRMEDYDPDIKKAPVVIREGAFIGGHSIILKGVTVGRHSVIGAGSVVTKDVPDNQVWAGNPAKKIKNIYDKNKNDGGVTICRTLPCVYYARARQEADILLAA